MGEFFFAAAAALKTPARNDITPMESTSRFTFIFQAATNWPSLIGRPTF